LFPESGNPHSEVSTATGLYRNLKPKLTINALRSAAMLSVASQNFELGFCLAQLAAVLWRRLQVAAAGLRATRAIHRRRRRNPACLILTEPMVTPTFMPTDSNICDVSRQIAAVRTRRSVWKITRCHRHTSPSGSTARIWPPASRADDD